MCSRFLERCRTESFCIIQFRWNELDSQLLYCISVRWANSRGHDPMGESGGGVRPASKTWPLLDLFKSKLCDFCSLIYDLTAKIRSLSRPEPSVNTLFQTWLFPSPDHIDVKGILKRHCKGFLSMTIDGGKKVVPSKRHAQFETIIQRLYSILDQNDQNRYPKYTVWGFPGPNSGWRI